MNSERVLGWSNQSIFIYPGWKNEGRVSRFLIDFNIEEIPMTLEQEELANRLDPHFEFHIPVLTYERVHSTSIPVPLRQIVREYIQHRGYRAYRIWHVEMPSDWKPLYQIKNKKEILYGMTNILDSLVNLAQLGYVISEIDFENIVSHNGKFKFFDNSHLERADPRIALISNLHEFVEMLELSRREFNRQSLEVLYDVFTCNPYEATEVYQRWLRRFCL